MSAPTLHIILDAGRLSQAGRFYSPEALGQIACQIVGRGVYATDPKVDMSGPRLISNMSGHVIAAQVVLNQLVVAVQWIGGHEPTDSEKNADLRFNGAGEFHKDSDYHIVTNITEVFGLDWVGELDKLDKLDTL